MDEGLPTLADSYGRLSGSPGRPGSLSQSRQNGLLKGREVIQKQRKQRKKAATSRCQRLALAGVTAVVHFP